MRKHTSKVLAILGFAVFLGYMDHISCFVMIGSFVAGQAVFPVSIWYLSQKMQSVFAWKVIPMEQAARSDERALFSVRETSGDYSGNRKISNRGTIPFLCYDIEGC